MTHEFTILSAILSRCGAKAAAEAIAEIRAAINDAVAQSTTATDVDTLLTPMQTEVEAAQTARREKAAARRAAKKAQKAAQTEAESQPQGSAERSESPRCGSVDVASRLAAGSAQPGGAEAPDECPAEAFSPEMVKYLRRCPEQYMLTVLNSYVNLVLTGNLVDTADDHRYLDNFITLARTLGIIDNPQPLTNEEAIAFMYDNPVIPRSRAERRALERQYRKELRKMHAGK